MISFFAAVVGFQPVLAHADVTTSNGKKYRIETCFRDSRKLQTRFIYPNRTAAFVIDGDSVTVAENDKAPQTAGERERSFALGHNFHAIHYNFEKLVSDRRKATPASGKATLRPGSTGALMYGGSATVLLGDDGRAEGYRFELPDMTQVELTFSDWRDPGRVPYRLELIHAGVTYDYRFTKVEFTLC